MRIKKAIIFFVLLAVSLNANSTILVKEFKKPSGQYKPVPFWHINGEMTTEGIRKQMKDAAAAGFSGVTLLPLADKTDTRPGTSPQYLTTDYFARYQDMIDVANELGMEIILYDDNDFPSGMAGGKMQEKYPNHTMKRLDRIVQIVQGPMVFTTKVPGIQLMAAVAVNQGTNQRIEISAFVKGGSLQWQVPAGEWNIQLFPLMIDEFHKKYLCMDFMDTTSVRYMIDETYEKYKERFGKYFGNTIKTTFFDDVGFWRHPRNWTASFNQKFEELNGFDPRPYYPALWENIGPETEAVRNAFFRTRAELLAEGFPKLVGKWNEANGLNSTGHPPGNYNLSPIDMNADIFKFYRYTQIPLTDAIIKYQYGQNGHKLISSAADFYDRPMVGVEIYGAYKEQTFDSLMLYRSMMDLFVRGANKVIPHGMWYNPELVYISPLVSPYSQKIAPALPAYSEYVGRASMLLRGGRRVSEIAVLYPFEGMAGWYSFNNPDSVRQGYNVAPETDYQTISCWLTNDIRRDFTFVHPEFLLDKKYEVRKGQLVLNNKENFQSYHTLIITGSKVITLATLQKIKQFYDNGGTLIATTMLPFKSAGLGNDEKVIALVSEIFGINPLQQTGLTETIEATNAAGGKAIFIPQPDEAKLKAVLDKNSDAVDVIFSNNPVLSTDMGKFNYIHKIKDGKHVYFFTNSSDETITTDVLLRGKLKPTVWDPHTGSVHNKKAYKYKKLNGQVYTRIPLNLDAVRSMFIIADQ